MGTAFADTAPLLMAHGYSPLVIAPGEKYPGERRATGQWLPATGWRKWCNEQPTTARIAAWTRMIGDDAPGVGVACGFGGVVAVDIDDETLIEPLLAILPPVFVAKRGRKGLTAFYRAGEPLPSKNYRTTDKRCLLDLLSEGKQTVLPPSIHPDTGEPYYWTTDRTLLDTTLADLPVFAREHFAAMEDVLRAHGWDADDRLQAHGGAVAEPVRWHGELAGNDAASLFREVNDLALANLPAWVPKLGLQRCYRSGGGFKAVAEWRSSGSGRSLARRNPNLSFTSQGIRDFGDGLGYSPIDVVMVAHRVSASEALDWLGALVSQSWREPLIVLTSRKKT